MSYGKQDFGMVIIEHTPKRGVYTYPRVILHFTDDIINYFFQTFIGRIKNYIKRFHLNECI